MATSKLFTSAGITTHARDGVTVTKIRYGTDHIRLIKMLSSNKKIGVSKAFGGRDDGFLDAVRVDIVELPNEMSKADALKFLASHAEFQSAADQATIQEQLEGFAPKAPKASKTVKVKASKKVAPSLDSIKARAKKSAVTAEQVIEAISTQTA